MVHTQHGIPLNEKNKAIKIYKLKWISIASALSDKRVKIKNSFIYKNKYTCMQYMFPIM
jgi:hypothetical protein